MAEDTKGATRIILGLHNAADVRRPSANMISRGEVYREISVLVEADLSLARMLDEFDGKLRTMNEGLFDFAADVRNDIVAVHLHALALEKRLEQLEARTLGGRWRRLRAWWDRRFTQLEADVVELVEAIDTNVGPRP